MILNFIMKLHCEITAAGLMYLSRHVGYYPSFFKPIMCERSTELVYVRYVNLCI